MSLLPIAIEDIPNGIGLPWHLYDHDGHILFARGKVLDHTLQMSLSGIPLFRDTDDESEKPEIIDITSSEFFPPSDIRPQIWERVQLRLLSPSRSDYYLTHLIGYIQKLSILITTPFVSGVPIILNEGERVEVRMVTGSNIYVFDTVIQRACTSPTHYMHLEYPAIMHVQKLRNSPWARVNLGASVTSAKGNQEISHIINLSSGGAQIHTPSSAGAAGESLKLSFHAVLDELTITLNLDAQIRHVRECRTGENEGEKMLEYGVSFLNLSGEDVLWLKALVYHHIAKGYLA